MPSHDDRLPEGVTRVRAQNAGALTLSGTNTYLWGEPAWVIDPGPPDEGHLERVVVAAQRCGGVAGIVLTHGHLDHAGNAGPLRERTGAPLAGRVARSADGAAGWQEPAAEGLELDQVLGEGESFGPFRVIETPGHSADHIALLVGKVLFCGDTILGEGSVLIPPGGGSLASYLESLEKLRGRGLESLCPGHGPIVWDPEAKLTEYIEHRLERERRLVDALESGARARNALLDEVWSDVPGELRPAAALTLEAHIDKLASEGRLPSDWTEQPRS